MDPTQTEKLQAEALFDLATEANQFLPALAVRLSPAAEELGLLLARTRLAIKDLQDCAAVIEQEMCNAMPGKTIEVPGVGTAEMHSGAKRTEWDKDGLRDVLAHAIANDIPPMVTTEGEPVNHVQYVKDVLDVYSTATTPSFKVTGLRAMQIDPEDYCHTAWGAKKIQMPALSHEGG